MVSEPDGGNDELERRARLLAASSGDVEHADRVAATLGGRGLRRVELPPLDADELELDPPFPLADPQAAADAARARRRYERDVARARRREQRGAFLEAFALVGLMLGLWLLVVAIAFATYVAAAGILG